MAQPSFETKILNEEEKFFLAEHARAFFREPVMREAQAVSWTESRLEELPNQLPHTLLSLRRAAGKTALLLVKGLDAPDNLPETPNVILPPAEVSVQREDQVAHMAIASLIGAIYGCDHTRYGRLTHDIFTLEHTNGYSYSQKGLDWHVDGAMDPKNAPPLFSMQCLRNNEQTPTIFSTVARDDLSSELWEMLHHPVWDIRFAAKKPQPTDVKNVAILESEGDTLYRINYYADPERLRLNEEVPVIKRPRYHRAIQELSKIFESNTREIILQPGEIVIVRNFLVVHGRPESQKIETHAERRWLSRHWVTDRAEQAARISLSAARSFASVRTPAESTEPCAGMANSNTTSFI